MLLENQKVKLRNDIAHGKRIPVNKDIFIEFKELTIYCMDTLKDHFDLYLQNKSFLEEKMVIM